MSSQFDDDVVMAQNRALLLSGDDPNAAAARHAEAREQALRVQAATEARLRCERTEQTLTPPSYLIDGEWVPRERIVSEKDRAVLDAMKGARIVYDPHGDKRPIFQYSEDEYRACEAELARREAKR